MERAYEMTLLSFKVINRICWESHIKCIQNKIIFDGEGETGFELENTTFICMCPLILPYLGYGLKNVHFNQYKLLTNKIK